MRATEEKFKRPELFLQELLRKYARGEMLDTTSNVQPFMRAVVLAVDMDGANLSNPDGVGSVTVDGKHQFKSQVGPVNPPNSIKARIISKGFDAFVTDSDVRVFWPMSQNDHLAMPIKPGEHVMVLFEDVHFEHGMWLCKVPGHDGVNFFEGASSYSSVPTKTAHDAFEKPQPQSITDVVASDSSDRKNMHELF